MAAARALWDIQKSDHALQVIASVIKDHRHNDEFTRIEAIGLLTHIRHPIAFAALEAGLFDPEYLVRYNAASILSENSAKKTGSVTIENNLAVLDHEKIHKFAERMRKKI